jgi:hypothetical protein
MATVLLVRPANDSVAVELSAWASKLKTASALGTSSIGVDLASGAATRSAVDSAMPSRDALFYFGHGTATALRGAGVDLVDTMNVGLMANRTIVAIACWSAKTLGPIAVTSSGLAAYLGFDDKLLWLTGDPDLQFGPAICSGPNDLIQGNDIGTALVSMRTQLQNVVTYYHSGSGKSNPNSIIGFLSAYWDSQHLALYGNASHTI